MLPNAISELVRDGMELGQADDQVDVRSLIPSAYDGAACFLSIASASGVSHSFIHAAAAAFYAASGVCANQLWTGQRDSRAVDARAREQGNVLRARDASGSGAIHEPGALPGPFAMTRSSLRFLLTVALHSLHAGASDDVNFKKHLGEC